jgi:isopenicillin N synthase-like dioxygenase
MMFEPQFPGICGKICDHENTHLLLRFLKYEWQSAGKYLAKPHFDAGSFTLAIAEDSSGLRIGSCPDNLKLVDHKEGHAIFMLSSNFQKVMNTNQLSAGWHDVIQLDETLIGKPFSRWAVVAFIDAQ